MYGKNILEKQLTQYMQIMCNSETNLLDSCLVKNPTDVNPFNHSYHIWVNVYETARF